MVLGGMYLLTQYASKRLRLAATMQVIMSMDKYNQRLLFMWVILLLFACCIQNTKGRHYLKEINLVNT